MKKARNYSLKKEVMKGAANIKRNCNYFVSLLTGVKPPIAGRFTLFDFLT